MRQSQEDRGHAQGIHDRKQTDENTQESDQNLMHLCRFLPMSVTRKYVNMRPVDTGFLRGIGDRDARFYRLLIQIKAGLGPCSYA